MSEYQQRAVKYQRDIAAALMETISQCAFRLQITEPLLVLPGFEAPPAADEEDHDEEAQGKKVKMRQGKVTKKQAKIKGWTRPTSSSPVQVSFLTHCFNEEH